MKRINYVRLLAPSSILTMALTMTSAMAAEETLKFRLVVMKINQMSLDAPNIEARSVSTGLYTGVAILEDGRIAHKAFVGITDYRGAEGNYSGYSTYTFENGDSLSLKYTGDWGDEKTGFGGDYKVLSGTGAYNGATGAGRFDSVKNPWENANLLDVTLNLTLPDS